MRKSPAIQKFLALLLLAVFAVGSAPKAYFHDLVADHVDRTGCTENHETAVLHQHETNCGFDDLVVPSVFLVVNQQLPAAPFVYSESQKHTLHQQGFHYFTQHKENRGPPAA